LKTHPEVWQPEIAQYLKKFIAKKKVPVKVTPIPAAEFKAKLSDVLKLHNIEGFMNKDTGEFSESLYSSIMSELSMQYGKALIAPRLMLKVVQATQLWTGENAPKAKWDGVKRKVEKGGFLAHHTYLRGSDIPVLSLAMEGFVPSGRAFENDGGFDVIWYVQRSFLSNLSGAGAPGAFKGLGDDKQIWADLDFLFGAKNLDNRSEAIEIASKPLTIRWAK